MKPPSNRLERTAEQIQRKLAHIIQQELSDPRLPGLVTISGVKLSKDSGDAAVYFTVLSTETVQAEKILNAAARYLRASLARTLEARVIPRLHFVYDHSLEQGRQLSRLIQEVHKKDVDG